MQCAQGVINERDRHDRISLIGPPAFAPRRNLSVTEQQRRLASTYATANRKAEEAAWRETQRAHAAHLRFERDTLRRDLNNLPLVVQDIEADSFYTADPARLQGALEELDYQRETMTARLARVESDLRRAGR